MVAAAANTANAPKVFAEAFMDMWVPSLAVIAGKSHGLLGRV
jgi:hypothetical protein